MCWSLDFVPDTLAPSFKFQMLLVNDECYDENLRLVANTSISGPQVARKLDPLVYSG